MGEEDVERRGDAFLASVARALTILERLAEGSRTLSELARELDVNKNIAHRLIFTLLELGFIIEDPRTREYRLTYKLLNLARTQWLSSDVLSQAEPVLKALARDTGELVRLALVEGDKLEWVFAETGVKRSLRIDPAYGGSIIPHVHATSKAYLMTLSGRDLNRQISRMTFKAYSPHTITNPLEFKAHIESSHREGFACSYEERDLGVAAVAAPVMARRAPTGIERCVAVISVSAPASRVSREQLATMACTLLLPAVKKLEEFWPI